MPTYHDVTTPNGAAQQLIEKYGLKDARTMVEAETSRRHRSKADTAFWSDVAALLRLETQSDEAEHEAAQREARWFAGEQKDEH